jgi:hypothetical protein
MKVMVSTRRVGPGGAVHEMADLGTDTLCGRRLREPWTYTNRRVTCQRCRKRMVKPHRHVFGSLWSHLGPHGRQDVHVHSCFTQGCDRVLVGAGRNCSGNVADHHREN